jgi:hypothetical protein
MLTAVNEGCFYKCSIIAGQIPSLYLFILKNSLLIVLTFIYASDYNSHSKKISDYSGLIIQLKVTHSTNCNLLRTGSQKHYVNSIINKLD